MSRVRCLYACIHALSMIYVYMYVYASVMLVAMLRHVDCVSLSFQLFILLLRKTWASVIVQVRSDAG